MPNLNVFLRSNSGLFVLQIDDLRIAKRGEKIDF